MTPDRWSLNISQNGPGAQGITGAQPFSPSGLPGTAREPLAFQQLVPPVCGKKKWAQKKASHSKCTELDLKPNFLVSSKMDENGGCQLPAQSGNFIWENKDHTGFGNVLCVINHRSLRCPRCPRQTLTQVLVAVLLMISSSCCDSSRY